MNLNAVSTWPTVSAWEPALNFKTCLIVDDSRIIRKVARRIVEGLGYEVDEAADGAEALSYCTGVMPDMILVDWNMPV